VTSPGADDYEQTRVGRTHRVHLHPDDLDAIADRVASEVLARLTDIPELQEAARARNFDATAEDIARRHGLTAAWVRTNAAMLGGVRIGTGPKPRHRFNAEIAEAHIASMCSGRDDRPLNTAPKVRKRRRRTADTHVPLLPITGRVQS